MIKYFVFYIVAIPNLSVNKVFKSLSETTFTCQNHDVYFK